MKKNGLIALEDGTLFWGKSFGAEGGFAGELVFNTAQTGYQEILSDPSYTDQILVFTSPHIGVVGVNSNDEESAKIYASGIISRSISEHTSNWRAQNSLPEYLKKHGKLGISDIDTRALTHLLREKGSQKAYVMTGHVDASYAVQKAKMFAGLTGYNLAKTISTKIAYEIPGRSAFALAGDEENGDIRGKKYSIVIIDFGIKESILKHLKNIAKKLIVVPSSSSLEDILSHSPDGVFLSNGPGDPAACHEELSVIQDLLEKDIPIFGICLGHQLLALASGAMTEKMHFGHHGSNHPILELETKKVYISSQNHGFVVSDKHLPECLKVTHRSLFDQSIAGIQHLEKPAFSFQGHPEASPGPFDLQFLFHQFESLMETSYAKVS